MMCWASVKAPADLCDHFHVDTAQPDVCFLYVGLAAGGFSDPVPSKMFAF